MITTKSESKQLTQLREELLKAVRERIRQLDLTQAEIGALLGVNQSRISMLMSGDYKQTTDVIVDIAFRLGLNLIWSFPSKEE